MFAKLHSFQNSNIEKITREQSLHLYTKDIDTYWAPKEPIMKETRIGKLNVKTKIYFHVQLVIGRTIHI